MRWLAVHGRLEEAEDVLNKVARINGHSVPSDARITLEKVAEEEHKVCGLNISIDF
jgi:hypothetical protein